MHLKKIYTLILISILNVVLLYAQEDLSVSISLKDKNITTVSQLIPTDPKYMHDIDKGYYLPVTISLVNNTNIIKNIELGATCSGYSPWEIEGDLYFVRKEIHCIKNLASHIVPLKPTESYKKIFRLFFPVNYLNRKLSFKIGFTETLYSYLDKPAYDKLNETYWSDTIIINEKLEDIPTK